MKTLLLLLGIGANLVAGEEVYVYEITSTDNGIYGEAINKKSEDNHGVFLCQSELDIEIDTGDLVAIKWGEHGDELKSIVKVKENEQ